MSKTITSLADLTSDPQNARRHTPRNVGMIERALNDVGAARSIVVDENGVVLAGNATIEAAAAAGIERVQVIDADGQTIIAVRRSNLTPEQKVNLALFDNRAAELAEWDTDVLLALSEEIDLSTFWTKDEIAAVLEQDAVTSGGGDDAPAVQDGPTRVQTGDLWQLGRHRLLCGDSTKAEDVARLMGGEKATCMWTDPPYNVDYEGKTSEALTLANDNMTTVEFCKFLCDAFSVADDVLCPGAVYYIAHPDIFAYEFIGAIRSCGWKHARPPVVQWVKDSIVMGRGDYHAKSEPILYGWKPGAAHHAVQDRTQSNVWEIPRPKASVDHPTMKPVELIERAIRNSSNIDDIVYEPFGGSGSTLIACERLHRQCRIVEIDPKYADVIISRFEAETGLPAERIDAAISQGAVS